ITEEKVGKLNAKLKIKVSPADYEKEYNEALKNARKRANIPGFRPGHVPLSLVKKQYGPSLLAEELNKLLNETIYKHINDNELRILGNPLPVDSEDTGDFTNPSEFEFEYELGLAPDIDLKLEKLKATYHIIKVDDKLIDQQVEDYARRYGSLSEPEASGEKDLLMGTFVQLNDSGEILEGGIMNDGTIAIEFIDDKKTKKALVGLKKGETVVVDPHKVSRDHDDLGRMLGISHDEVHDLKGDFQFKINEIKQLTAAPVDQALFDKVFGKDEVADLDGFRSKIADRLQMEFKKDQDWLFKREVSSELIAKVDPELPDEFLKRWIQASNENEVSAEQVEQDYPQYSKGLKWQLIEGKIFSDNELKVENEEVLDFAKANIANQYAQYG
ncbi:MAG: trigger factor, partial [Flavobacteriales bacterium]|nr:trigger factor [Flavobacteriales bacterium]